MLVTEFNAVDRPAAAERVRVWADIESWVDAVLHARPYHSVEEVAAHAEQLSEAWTVADLDAALARHPRIGQRAHGENADAHASRAEQAAVATAQRGVVAAIAEVNAEYEARFGRVFLIRAAGRSAEEILAEARRRLRNDDHSEAREALDQLREIALVRLRADLSDESDEKV